jgi:hypothetical protein
LIATAEAVALEAEAGPNRTRYENKNHPSDAVNARPPSQATQWIEDCTPLPGGGVADRGLSVMTHV